MTCWTRYAFNMDRGLSAVAESFSFDVVVIGAGPTGLACGIDAKRAGLTVANIDKGCLVNSLYNYPSNMTFFTTPELLEIGDLPFSSPNQKPTRQEALEYYRKAAEHYQLDVRQYEPVSKVEGSDNRFVVHTTNLHGHQREYRARIIKWAADKVFEVTGRNAKLDIALELERIALEDDYFVKRKLYPNVDFYSR